MKRWLIPLLALLLLLTGTAALADNDFSFETNTYTVFEDDVIQLNLIRKSGATQEGKLTYTTSNPKAVTVDENGLATAVGKGAATITATLKTEKKTFKAAAKITVQRAVTSIELNTGKMTYYKDPSDPDLDGLLSLDEGADLPVIVLSVGTNAAINATLLPKDASNKKFSVTTTDKKEKVVKIVSNGTGIKPVASGECILTIASASNPEVSQSFHILVTQPVKSITLTSDAEKNNIYVGEKTTITASFTPSDVTFTSLTWSSNNEKVAKVNKNGVVTGVGRGNASITAKATDGSKKTATIRINVLQQPTEITLSPVNPTIAVGAPRVMKATVLPANVNEKSVTWTSSDDSIATVNSQGRITPVAPGECTITCYSTNFPEVYAETIVSIIQPAQKITFAKNEVNVIVGETTFVSHTIYPDYTTDQSVTYSSNNSKVAVVDSEGVITGLKAGSATITVKTADGSNKRANVKVNVIQPVEGVHMKDDSATVGVEEQVTLTAVLEPSDATNTRMVWESSDTSIATVSGNRTRPVVTGHAWGDVVITGITEDGGYTTSCDVKVGNFDKALEISDLYVDGNNKIRLAITNVSNMNITRFYLLVEVYDLNGEPLPCTTTGNNVFEASYAEELGAGMTTQHNRFNFYGFAQPSEIIGRVIVSVTGYLSDEGYSRNIKESKQPTADYMSVFYHEDVEIEPSGI